jgi:putative oxidoreductase
MSVVNRWSALAPKILGIARIIAGLMFFTHGAQKVLGWFGGMPPGVPFWIRGIGGTIELVGGLLIALGLFTRPVAFLCSGMMAVAYFHGHAMPAQGIDFFLPKQNKGELAVMYCWFFLYLSAAGPGAFALDNLRRRR